MISGHQILYSQQDIKIWGEFTSTLKASDFPSEKLRPYYESFREPILGYLKQMRKKADWEEWEATPETHRVGNKIHFIIPLTFDDETATYCFTFLDESGVWYFQHIEAITIRLDKLASIPTSKFPDLSEAKKASLREEGRVSELVRLFNFLATEKGKEFAYSWFKDGKGYALAAQTWVPFFPLSKSFVLYLCWELSNLRGNEITLEKLEENEALVRMNLIYFNLYKVAAHLKQQISKEDYYNIFEMIWQDRAEKAGWKVEFKYLDDDCLFRFWKK
jgi:hypothetical protein